MKIWMLIALMLLSGQANASNRTAVNMSLAEQLGTVAGLAYACDAGKSLEDYELISSRFLANTAETDEKEQQAYESYASSKLRAFKMHNEKPQMSCADILKRFKAMKIFKFVVYADGSIKTSEGKLLKPKRPVKMQKQKKK